MKKLVAIILGLFIVIIFWPNGFYADFTRDWDAYRLPLIKPYELISLKEEETSWHVPNDIERAMLFEGVMSSNGSPAPDSIGIKGNLILLHSKGELVRGKSGFYPLWFVFDSDQKKGVYFGTRKEFEDHLGSLGVTTFKFYDPKLIFKDFRENGVLPEEWDIENR